MAKYRLTVNGLCAYGVHCPYLQLIFVLKVSLFVPKISACTQHDSTFTEGVYTCTSWCLYLYQRYLLLCRRFLYLYYRYLCTCTESFSTRTDGVYILVLKSVSTSKKSVSTTTGCFYTCTQWFLVWVSLLVLKVSTCTENVSTLLLFGFIVPTHTSTLEHLYWKYLYLYWKCLYL